MSIALLVLAGLLLACGAVACVIPVLPGPLVSFCGLLCLIPTACKPSVFTLVVFGLVTAMATSLDCIVPALGAKKFKCSKWGTWGCVIGTLLGVFFFPIGLLLGPFLGAFVGELIAGRKAREAAKGGLGAFLGFLSGVAIKLIACIARLLHSLSVRKTRKISRPTGMYGVEGDCARPNPRHVIDRQVR